MKISIAGQLPPPDQLSNALNNAFAPRYTFRTFGLGKNKSVMARKSTFVGLQLSVVGNEIDLQPTAPTIAGSALSFMMLTELVAILIIPTLFIFKGFTKDPYKEMAREIGLFLKAEYGYQSQ